MVQKKKKKKKSTQNIACSQCKLDTSQAKPTKTIYTKSSHKASPQKQQTTHSGDVLKKRRDKGSTILVQLKKNQKD